MTFFDTEDAIAFERERRADLHRLRTMMPARRLAVLRNRLQLLNLLNDDFPLNGPDQAIADNSERWDEAITDVIDQLNYLETNGQLEFLQELLMAESAGTP